MSDKNLNPIIQFKEWFERPTSVIMPAPMFYNIERPDLS